MAASPQRLLFWRPLQPQACTPPGTREKLLVGLSGKSVSPGAQLSSEIGGQAHSDTITGRLTPHRAAELPSPCHPNGWALGELPCHSPTFGGSS